jgi:hypothetical protein
MKKIPVAIQAEKMPIFKMFAFVKSLQAEVKAMQDGKTLVKFHDGSSFVLTKNGDVLFPFLVSAVKYFSQHPFEWIFAKNENQAISIFKNKHKTGMFVELDAACDF